MRRIAIAICFLLAPVAAQAINCTWDVVPTNINFGAYSAFSSSAVTATSAFQFTCTPPAIATMTISRGTSASFNPRIMTRTTLPAITMNYNLFMDQPGSRIWGDGTGGSQTLTATSAAGSASFQVFGRIPARQGQVHVGSYSDTIMVTVNF